jgi:hypothetical protein
MHYFYHGKNGQNFGHFYNPIWLPWFPFRPRYIIWFSPYFLIKDTTLHTYICLPWLDSICVLNSTGRDDIK